MVVVWSEAAEKELLNILDYLEYESPQNAENVIVKIIDSTLSLPQHLYKHPADKLKQNNDGSWRAFEVIGFRVSYKIFSDYIIIIRLRHTKQSPLNY